MKKYLLVLGVLTTTLLHFSIAAPVQATDIADRPFVVCPSGRAGQNGCQYIGGEGIQQAVDAAQNGDTVSIKSGTYTNQNPRDFGGGSKAFILVQDKNITLEGEAGVIIDGSASPADTCGITIKNNSQVTINEISVTGMRSRVVGGSLYCGIGMLIAYDSPKAVVTNSQFTDNEGAGIQLANNAQLIAESITANGSKKTNGIYMKGQPKAEIRNSQLNNNATTNIKLSDNAQLIAENITANGAKKYNGISLRDDSSAVITNGLLASNTIFGAELYRNAKLSLINTTLSNNRLGGVGIQNTPTLSVKNSIIVNHAGENNKYGFGVGSREYSGKGTNWVALRASNKISVSKSLFWNNVAGDKNCGTHQICDFPGKIEADPLFVDPANGDYRLQPNSPACTGGEGGTHMGAFPCNQSDIGTLTDLTVTCSDASVNPPTATFSWKRQTTNPIEDHTIRINMVNACTNPLSQLLVPWYCPGPTANSEDQAHAFQVGGSSDSGRCSNGNCSVTLPIKRDTLYPEWSIEIAHVSNAFTTPRPLTRVNAPRFFCGTLQPGTISDMTVTCSSPSAASPTATFSWKRDSLYPIEVHNLRINMRNTCTGSNNQPIVWMCPDSTSNTEDQFRVIKIGGALDAGGSADTGNCTDGVCSVTVPVVADAVYDDWSVEATLPLPNNQSGVPLLRTANLPSFTCPSSLLGDVDGSGAVDQADLTALSAVLYTENCSYRLSANNPENCLVTIADYNELVSILRR